MGGKRGDKAEAGGAERYGAMCEGSFRSLRNIITILIAALLKTCRAFYRAWQKGKLSGTPIFDQVKIILCNLGKKKKTILVLKKGPLANKFVILQKYRSRKIQNQCRRSVKCVHSQIESGEGKENSSYLKTRPATFSGGKKSWSDQVAAVGGVS